MNKNIKKILMSTIMTVLLISCGGNDNGGSTGGTKNPSTNISAPQNADAFEAKFLNKTITPPSGHKITILANKTLIQTLNGERSTKTYTFRAIDKKSVHLSYTIKDIDCSVTLYFLTSTNGNAKESYTSTSFNQNSNGTFEIDGSN